MTDQLIDHLWVPRALMCPSGAVSLNLSQNAATHWVSIASEDSVHYILTKVFFCVSSLIARVCMCSFTLILSQSNCKVIWSPCWEKHFVQGLGHIQGHFSQLPLPPNSGWGTETEMSFCQLWLSGWYYQWSLYHISNPVCHAVVLDE